VRVVVAKGRAMQSKATVILLVAREKKIVLPSDDSPLTQVPLVPFVHWRHDRRPRARSDTRRRVRGVGGDTLVVLDTPFFVMGPSAAVLAVVAARGGDALLYRRDGGAGRRRGNALEGRGARC